MDARQANFSNALPTNKSRQIIFFNLFISSVQKVQLKFNWAKKSSKNLEKNFNRKIFFLDLDSWYL